MKKTSILLLLIIIVVIVAKLANQVILAKTLIALREKPSHLWRGKKGQSFDTPATNVNVTGVKKDRK